MPDSPEALVPAVTVTADAEMIAAETGAPPHSRRLTDKVLAAFNHAYAVGEVEVAGMLREILAKLERDRTHLHTHGQRSANPLALRQADLWVEFVEARNDYRVACNDESLDAEALARVLEAMKQAYLRWSSC